VRALRAVANVVAPCPDVSLCRVYTVECAVRLMLLSCEWLLRPMLRPRCQGQASKLLGGLAGAPSLRDAVVRQYALCSLSATLPCASATRCTGSQSWHS
jgi:hypothetical protein